MGRGYNNHPHPTGTHPAILTTHPLDVPAFPHHHPPTVDTGFRRQDERNRYVPSSVVPDPDPVPTVGRGPRRGNRRYATSQSARHLLNNNP